MLGVQNISATARNKRLKTLVLSGGDNPVHFIGPDKQAEIQDERDDPESNEQIDFILKMARGWSIATVSDIAVHGPSLSEILRVGAGRVLPVHQGASTGRLSNVGVIPP